MLKKQIWWCEKCAKAGKVNYEEDALLLEVMGAVKANHREVSPQCQTNNLHYLNLDSILGRVLPFWAKEAIVKLLEEAT